MAEFADAAEFEEWMHNFDSSCVDDILRGLEGTPEHDLTYEELSTSDVNGQRWAQTGCPVSPSVSNCFSAATSSVVNETSRCPAINSDKGQKKDAFYGRLSDFESDCDSRETADDEANSFWHDSALISIRDDASDSEDGGFNRRVGTRTVSKPKTYSDAAGRSSHSILRQTNESENNKRDKCSSSRRKHNNLSMSRNAIIARKNRTKKKRYEENLKAVVKHLANENTVLKKKYQEKEDVVQTLTSEVIYLKHVLANSTVLSRLLHHIPNCLSGNSVDDGPMPNMEKADSGGDTDMETLNNIDRNAVNVDSDIVKVDHDYDGLRPLDSRINGETAGICLHVATNRVSLEFCSTCSNSAQRNNRFYTQRCSRS